MIIKIFNKPFKVLPIISIVGLIYMRLQRSYPWLQILDGERLICSSYPRYQKRLCLQTSRGRSVTRITRRSRLMFRQLLQQNLVFGFQPSQW